ncbi:hypothetical protein COCOR_06869 [Corallococcus coralloides DSM 2259]|uniref:Uncharacterized protein n=2 Tax=Corallococcus coralloides TaxID=184914 RepID=H8N113_CORCM|nr:hypothetical protein COCOR_06869 [Corallococcus coralloides DSM 2259]
MKISGGLLNQLWNAHKLSREYASSAAATKRRVAAMFDAEWVHRFELDDLVSDMDSRLVHYGVNSFDLARALELPVRTAFAAPRHKTQENFSGSQMLHAHDVAGLLIWLEELGFDVDPSELVARVKQQLKGKRYLTDPEISVHLYEKQRSRSEARLDAPGAGAPVRSETSTTPHGYRMEALLDSEGKCVSLHVKGARWRASRKPEPVAMECPDCKLTYVNGDREDGIVHRRHHNNWLAVERPSPNPRFAALSTSARIVQVDARSPRWLRKAMYDRALHFKRELHFDFVQWDIDEKDGPDRCVGFLFASDEGATITGACAFRWREDANWSPAWAMQWMWLAPPYRRRGILTQHWPSFIARFGAFRLERPLSEAMREFAAKRGIPEKEDDGGDPIAR